MNGIISSINPITAKDKAIVATSSTTSLNNYLDEETTLECVVSNLLTCERTDETTGSIVTYYVIVTDKGSFTTQSVNLNDKISQLLEITRDSNEPTDIKCIFRKETAKKSGRRFINVLIV